MAPSFPPSEHQTVDPIDDNTPTGPDPNNEANRANVAIENHPSDNDLRVVVVGLNHDSAPSDVLERASFSSEQLPDALTKLRRQVGDGVILSTGSRTEIYTLTHDAERSADQVQKFVSKYHGLEPEILQACLYVKTGQDAARHLFQVAGGLDSVIPGEWQVLGQVRDALKAAVRNHPGSLPPALYRIFHASVETGRRARETTGFGSNEMTLGQTVAESAQQTLGDLNETSVLLIGAGRVAKLVAKGLRAAGVGSLIIANRTLLNGERLATELGARAIPASAVASVLEHADIVVSATGAPEHTVTKDMARAAMRRRSGKQMFIADLAVPPDVDPEVGMVDNVELAIIDGLKGTGGSGPEEQEKAKSSAETVVEQGLSQFESLTSSLDVAPKIRALQQQAEAIRQQELGRSVCESAGFSAAQHDAIDALTKSIVKKMLNERITALEERAKTSPS